MGINQSTSTVVNDLDTRIRHLLINRQLDQESTGKLNIHDAIQDKFRKTGSVSRNSIQTTQFRISSGNWIHISKRRSPG